MDLFVFIFLSIYVFLLFVFLFISLYFSLFIYFSLFMFIFRYFCLFACAYLLGYISFCLFISLCSRQEEPGSLPSRWPCSGSLPPSPSVCCVSPTRGPSVTSIHMEGPLRGPPQGLLGPLSTHSWGCRRCCRRCRRNICSSTAELRCIETGSSGSSRSRCCCRATLDRRRGCLLLLL